MLTDIGVIQITAHPADYEFAGDWQANDVHILQKLVPPTQRGMLDQLFIPRNKGDGLIIGIRMLWIGS